MLQSYVNARLGGVFETKRLRKSRMVELGAGCGVGGMALALQGAKVTFTDKAEVLHHCRDNVRRNLTDLTHVDFKSFLWGTDPTAAHLEPPYDLVLATDPFVLNETRDAFLHALRSLSGAETIIAIAFQVRRQEVFDSLLEGLASFGFEVGEVHPMRLARAARLSGYSGMWIPIILARLAPRSTPGDLQWLPAQLSPDEVRIASAAAEPTWTTNPEQRR